MNLTDIHAVQSGMFYSQKCYRAKNASIRQAGTPVPAAHIVCLAQMHKSFHCIFVSMCFIFLVSCRHKFQRRSDNDTKSIFSFFQNLLHRKLPDSVHTFYSSQTALIQINIPNRINSVKPQDYFLTVFKFCFVIYKYSFIFVIFLHQCLRLIFVIFPKWIFHFSSLKKSHINISRHLRRNPFLLFHITQLPVLMKLHFYHCSLSLHRIQNPCRIPSDIFNPLCIQLRISLQYHYTLPQPSVPLKA